MRVGGRGGDVLSSGVAFDLTSLAGRYVANLVLVQCSEISENPTPLRHIGTRISFTLILGHIYEIANIAAFLDFKIVPSDVLLPHNAFYDGFTAAKILVPIGEVEQYLDYVFD